MKRNATENNRLEFKLRIDLSGPGAKAELVRDVIALANSEGEWPREEGYLVVGFKNGTCHDVTQEHYDDATFRQILDSYISPPLNVAYREFGNRAGGRAGVLIVTPEPLTLYVVRKRMNDGQQGVLLYPGQCWGRRSSGKAELDGDAIVARTEAILAQKLDACAAPLRERIAKLESEAGPMLDVRRIRYEMEATSDWEKLEDCLARLLPYAHEYDDPIRQEILYAIHAATMWTRHDMSASGARAIDVLLGEMMPVRAGGMHHPASVPLSVGDQQLLKGIENVAYEVLWDACRYIRDPKILEIPIHRYWSLIRFTALNKLTRLRDAFMENLRHCQNICNETSKGRTFPEGWNAIEETMKDALDLPQPDKKVKKSK